jgi:hypothetical protein
MEGLTQRLDAIHFIKIRKKLVGLGLVVRGRKGIGRRDDEVKEGDRFPQVVVQIVRIDERPAKKKKKKKIN